MKQRIHKPITHDPRVDVVTAAVFLLAILVTFAIADAQRPQRYPAWHYRHYQRRP